MILLVTVLVAVAAVLAVIGFWSLPTAADRIVAGTRAMNSPKP